jgi:hypothetical protein
MKRTTSLVLFLTLTTFGASQSGPRVNVYDMNYLQTTVPPLVKAHNDLDGVVQIHRKALNDLVASQAAALKAIAELEGRISQLEANKPNRLARLEGTNE